MRALTHHMCQSHIYTRTMFLLFCLHLYVYMGLYFHWEILVQCYVRVLLSAGGFGGKPWERSIYRTGRRALGAQLFSCWLEALGQDDRGTACRASSVPRNEALLEPI